MNTQGNNFLAHFIELVTTNNLGYDGIPEVEPIPKEFEFPNNYDKWLNLNFILRI